MCSSGGSRPTRPGGGGGGGPVTPCDPVPEYHLHVDANRDGTVDSDRTGIDTWTWGAGQKGAVVFCNNDDDAGAAACDNSDGQVNAGNDGSELAPFQIRRIGPAPPGDWVGELELSAADALRVRIFDSRAAGSAAILGGGVETYRLPTLGFTLKEFWMEAVRYAGTGFDGEITLMFRLIKGGVAGGAEQAKFRVAPWMMPSHLDAATKVFVVDAGADNRRFRRDLNGFVTGAGCTLQAHASTDIWMQDCMELGYSSIPGAGIPAVTRAPRNRPLKDFPVTLRRADFGYHEPGTLRPNTTFDSTGNLECTPPVTSEAGKRYPWGRIYYGAGRPGEEMDAELREFLQRQVVQAPIEIDTNWLAVGHVDEIISIVPAPTPKGFKLLLANPDHAYRILNNNKAAHGGSHLLVGRQFPEYRADGTFRRWHNAEVSIRRYLDHGIPHLAPDPLIQRIFNTVCQGFLDSTRAQLRTELGLTDADIIDVPILFMPNHDLPILADALTAGMVNMLVVNNHCIVPKPFGPVVGGRDLFEEDLRNNLTPLGLTVHFLDDWYEYHVNLGEVHCGTNTLRTPTRANWWEFVP